MRKTMAQKIICIVVASLFLINNIAYGLSPMPGSRQPGTQDAMLALGVKLLAAKNGPGAIDFDSYRPRSFVGDELLSHTDVGAYIEEANGYKTKFVKADYDNPPEAWENNPILIKETDLIRALKGFSATEAKISAENLDIREGYFLVDEEKGELPVARIEKVGENKYVLIVHTKFVQLWNHIRKNDVWFEANLGPNDRRTISVAWGIFYRLAKHELTDLKHENLLPKSIGHIRSINGEVILNKDEIAANTIGGNYRLLNDAIWMWFLGAYCFSNATRYNNETFLQRINWMFDDKGAAELGIDSELPQLFSDRENRTLATAFAYAINYRFFNRPGIVVPKTSVDEKFIRESEEREKARKAIGITEKPIYATGQAPAPDKKVTIENLSVDPLAEAVTTEIRSDFATKTREKEKVVKLWNNFIEERATMGMTVNIADVKKTIAAKIKMEKGIRNSGIPFGIAAISAGIVSIFFGLWPLSVAFSVVGLFIIVASRWDIGQEERFATLAGYLEKAEKSLASQTVATVKEGQAPAPDKKVTIENLSVDTLTEAVTTEIRSDFATKTREKEKVVKLWNNFIEERATIGMTVNIADVKKAIADRIKMDKIDSGVERVLGLASIGAGIVAVISFTSLWPVSVLLGVVGFAIIVASEWNIVKEKRFATLAGYLEKAEEGLATQTVTIENLSVDTLTEAVTAAIRSDFATKTWEKEKVVELWNNFIKECAPIGMTVNIADVKKTIAAKIKMDKIDRDVGRVLGLASIGAGIVFVIRYPDFWPTSVFLGVVGFAIIVASRWAIDREKRFATLAGYLEKAENGLASQTVSTVKEEQISAVTEVASEEKTPESRASSTSEEAVPTTRPIVEEHPFVKLISEYIVRLGLEKGPGIEALSTVELENLYKTVNLLSEVHVELFIPQQVKLTENMQTAIKDMGKKEGGSYIICRQYSDLQNLTKLLESPPTGKRIVITDIAEEKDQDEMARLVAKHPESFRVTRLLNIMLPVNYSNMDNIEKTVYQAKIVTIAILARLFEKNKTPMVEMLLRYMIKGCLDVDDKGMNEYFDELGNPNDGQGLSREALIKRILFLIGKTIKVVERIGEEIRLMKAFWTAA